MSNKDAHDGGHVSVPNKEPIIFTLPGHTVDTKLQVFGQGFHVHSLMLKIGSRFFRKFMDSPDKTPAPSGALFRYEYDAVVDKDGETWGLEAVSKIVEGQKTVLKSGDLNGEIEGFNRLICCIYYQPFDFKDVDDLQTLATLAEFYGAGPTVSVSLDGAVARSLESLRDMQDEALSYLKVAYRLRNKFLYKESMVHVAGSWSRHKQDLSGNDFPKLRRCAIIAHAGIASMLDEANIAILKITGRDISVTSSHYDTKQISQSQDIHIRQRFQYYATKWQGYDTLASFYQALYEEEFTAAPVNTFLNPAISASQRVRNIVGPLLKNNLALDKSGKVGKGDYIDCFLCAEVADEDLPWDAEETDW